MSSKTLNNHIEIIVGTFVVGTLAFIVANSWNDFAREGLKKLEENEGVHGNGMIFYSGIYVIVITLISLFIVYMLVYFEIVRHSGHAP